MAGQVVRVIHFLFPGSYNYSKSILNIAIDTNLTLVMMLVAYLVYYRIKEGKEISLEYQKMIRSVIVGSVVLGIILYAGVSLYNTIIGIDALRDVSIFVWDENWGTGRGMHYRDAVELFGRMNFLQKMIGVGADGFCVFAYSFPDIAAYFHEVFDGSVLTNAHCEMLTNMINVGVVGTLLYIGILVSFVVRCIKEGEKRPVAYIPAISVICYCTNNLVSFAQVLNFPFLLLVMGMGECYLRRVVVE